MRIVVALALCVSMLCGCVITQVGHLYPIQGTLSKVTPMPIYTVTFKNIGHSGAISANLAGQVLTGSWTTLGPGDPSVNRLAANWDMVYGTGFFNAQVLGRPLVARSVLMGNGNVTLTIEFADTAEVLTPTYGQHVRGVAVDNQGNVYKLTFE
jgi:hypothetical protein